MSDFDPDGPLNAHSLFGLPKHPNPKIEILPIPWEATTSYGRGTRKAPNAIQNASIQIDLFDLEYGAFWKEGIFMHQEHERLLELSDLAEPIAQLVIEKDGINCEKEASTVDEMSDEIQEYIYEKSKNLIEKDKIVGVLGGDHSCPYGLIKAASEYYKEDFGILHIDAHLDLRDGYLGFRTSHASIFWHVSKLTDVKKIVGLGFRDVGEREVLYAQSLGVRHRAYYDHELSRRVLSGESWLSIVNECIQNLPKNVHISLDIDGLDPSLCPNTGTPVAGGLSFQQLQLLLFRLSQSRNIVSFDLCEVSPAPNNEWDANVGARVLYKMCGAAIASKRINLAYV